MAKESSITAAILRTLNNLPETYAYKIHISSMMTAGLPDICAIRAGRAYYLEVKLPGNKPTAIQMARMGMLSAAGAVVAVVHSVEEAREIVK